MRRTASEVIRNLEMRVARLEKQSSKDIEHTYKLTRNQAGRVMDLLLNNRRQDSMPHEYLAKQGVRILNAKVTPEMEIYYEGGDQDYGAFPHEAPEMLSGYTGYIKVKVFYVYQDKVLNTDTEWPIYLTYSRHGHMDYETEKQVNEELFRNKYALDSPNTDFGALDRFM